MAPAPSKPPISRWLVTTDWLAARLRSPDLVVVDGSYYLPAHKRDAAEIGRASCRERVSIDV